MVMTIEDIFDLWKQDSIIDRTELGDESIKIPQLHYKYFKLFSTERLKYVKAVEDLKKLKKLKHEYYNGTLSYEDLKEYGWEPHQLKLLKQDIPTYIDSDDDVIQHNLKISYMKEKLDLLEAIIRSLNNRGFQIKSAIDWERFKVGA